MKTSLLKLAGILVGAFALTSSAIAVPINGTIYIDWNAPGFVFRTPTEIQFPASSPNAHVSYGTGDYAGYVFGTQADFFNITYVPLTPGKLWELTATPTTNFWITGFNAPDFTNNGATISGTGLANLAGFDATGGTWTMSFTSPTGNGQFSWVSTTSVSGVPEGGLTAAMLGLGLLGLGLAARRQKSA